MKITASWATNYIFLPIKSVTRLTYQAVSSLRNKPALQEVIDDVFSGALRAFDFTNVRDLLHIPIVPKILRELFIINTPPILAYLATKFTTQQARYYLSEYTMAKYSLNTLDFVAYATFSAFTIKIFYQNSILSIAMTKALADEADEPKYRKNKTVIEVEKNCGCPENELFKSDFFSPIVYFTRMLSINACEYLPVVCYVAPIAEIYHFGYSLLEYRYSMHQCTLHRMQDMANYNAYAFGIGLSFYLLEQGTSFLVNYLTGVNDKMVTRSISAAFYPWFIAAVFLKAPIEKRRGTEFFYYHQHLLQMIIQHASQKISELLNNPQKNLDYSFFMESFKKNALIKKTMEYLVNNGETILVDWLEDFFSDEVHALLFDVYFNQIKANIENLITLQKPLRLQDVTELPRGIIISTVATLPSFVSCLFVTKEQKFLLKTLKQKTLREPVKVVADLLERIRVRQLERRSSQSGYSRLINSYSLFSKVRFIPNNRDTAETESLLFDKKNDLPQQDNDSDDDWVNVVITKKNVI